MLLAIAHPPNKTCGAKSKILLLTPSHLSSKLFNDIIIDQSGTKCGVGSHRTCSHFFWLIARILTIFDKKYSILTPATKESLI